nr:hypothetical protein [uncultured Bacteroides sp.]
MEDISTIENLIKEIESRKEVYATQLINFLMNTNNFALCNKVAFVLVDNFKDDRIEDCLVKLIKDPKWKNRNGTLLYLLGEYTTNSKYLKFLIDLIIENTDDGEIYMGAYSMIINMQPPLDKKEIVRCVKFLNEERTKENHDEYKKQMIDSILKDLDGQKDICEFYKQFKD